MDNVNALQLTQLLVVTVLGFITAVAIVLLMKLSVALARVVLPLVALALIGYTLFYTGVGDYLTLFIERHGVLSLMLFGLAFLFGMIFALKPRSSSNLYK